MYKKGRKLQMLNQIVLVGRIESEPQAYETMGVKMVEFTLSVERSMKNSDGEFDVDVLPVEMWRGACNNLEDLVVGNLVGVKGRLAFNDKVVIVAEKLTFLMPRS